MSWNVSLPATPAAEFDAAVDALELPVREHMTPDAYGPEAQAQFAAAKAAAKAIAASGALGRGPFGCQLNGHANPDHAPREGWANDTMNVSVYQMVTPA